MSCSEGEAGGCGGGEDVGSTPGGPVVKYFLPAIFGGLTLLLAKRWATSPGSPNNSHPHSLSGISRRRRIVKDPPVRRAPPPLPNSPPPPPPPPPLSQSHLRGSAKRPDTNRKSNSFYGQQEDDPNMTLGGRKFPRSGRLSPSLSGDCSKMNSSRTKLNISGINLVIPNELADGPRHIPFPNIPQDGELLFEVMSFVYIAIATAMQFFNIYRTVWWLPHSYNNQTMNFYLIDHYLVTFILTITARRLIFCLCNMALEAACPAKYIQLARHGIRFSILIAIFGTLGWCTYNLIRTHSLLNIFYLCYPLVIYLLLFGINVTPFLQLVSWGNRNPHCCASGAPGIRNEVELLKADFNSRLKQIIFSSVIGAYYSSYIPWCFTQSFVHFDVYRVIRHLTIVWIGLFTQHSCQCLSAKFCDQLHRAALHLGRWERPCNISSSSIPLNGFSSSSNNLNANNSTNIPSGSVSQWCHKTIWPPGSTVKHGREIYTAYGCITAAAEPGNEMHWRFFMLFSNPSTLICLALCLQITLVLFQLFVLFNTSEWNHVISLAVLLFSNYYTLFKLIRDYLVAWRVYQAEFSIQYKTSTTPKKIIYSNIYSKKTTLTII